MKFIVTNTGSVSALIKQLFLRMRVPNSGQNVNKERVYKSAPFTKVESASAAVPAGKADANVDM